MVGAEQIGIVGVLLAGIAALWKIQQGAYRKAEEERREAFGQLIKKHEDESVSLREEIKFMHQERKTERCEWLKALENNTEQIKSVADKLQAIPNLQSDMDCLRLDIQEIKNKLNGGV